MPLAPVDPSRTAGLRRFVRGRVAAAFAQLRRGLAAWQQAPLLFSVAGAVDAFNAWWSSAALPIAAWDARPTLARAFAQGMRRAWQDSAASGEPPLGANQRARDSLGHTAARLTSDLSGVAEQLGRRLAALWGDAQLAGVPADLAPAVAVFQRRAAAAAQDAVARAHAEGQLEMFERLGVQQVTGLVERGQGPQLNELVENTPKKGARAKFRSQFGACPRCKRLNGRIFEIAKARGVIPVHPNCRCVWIPWQGVSRNY